MTKEEMKKYTVVQEVLLDVEACPICGHCAPFGHFIISMEGDKCLTKQEKPSTGRN